MPRTAKGGGRGGQRQGVQGKAYSNRTDLNDGPRVQRPHVAAAASEPMATVTDLPGAGAPVPMPRVGPDVPSMYPDRPLTHGMPFGPGAGPEVSQFGVLTPLQKLKRLYAANPNPDLLELIMLASPDA